MGAITEKRVDGNLINTDTGEITTKAGARPPLADSHTPQELTVSGAVTAGVRIVELNHASTIIAATIADASKHVGVFIVKNTSASGTAAHTLTLTSGTFDGTNDIATLDAPAEMLAVFFDGSGNGTVIQNTGTVGLTAS